MVIYKYPLNLAGNNTIFTGDAKAKPLAVAEQNGRLMLWVEMDENYAQGKDYFLDVKIVGTGQKYLPSSRGHIGTVIMSYGLVWHVFADIFKAYTEAEVERGD